MDWIPTSERNPEERGLYLCSLSDDTIFICYWHVPQGCEVFQGGARWIAPYKRTVIAWTPLPEPYKEKENKNGKLDN